MGKEMNGILVVFVLALLCSTGFASLNPKIQMQAYEISEVPAQPGHVINLTMNLKSLEWDNCADRVAVQISTSYPLSVQGMDTKYINQLCVNDSEAKGKVSFLLPVDSLAQSGTYQVFVTTTYEKRFAKYSESNTINVRVGGEPSIIASVASSTPQDIYPGDSATITLNLHNNGSGKAESVIAQLHGANGIEVKWAGREQVIGEIAARGTETAMFDIEVSKNALPGNYSLYLKLTYASENTTEQNTDFYFDIPVKAKAEFEASGNHGTQLVNSENKEITVQLKNTGSAIAKNLKIRIKPVFPFSTDGTIRYVDSLAAGEETTLTYEIHVDKDATPGQQISGLLIDFEDAQGKKFSDSVDFTLSVRRKTILEQVMEFWYVGVLMGLVVLVVILRRIRKMLSRKKQ